MLVSARISYVLFYIENLHLGVPIECIPPPDFAGNHKAYVENYCWIHHTYSS